MILFCVLLYLLIGFILTSFIHYKDSWAWSFSFGACVTILWPMIFPVWACGFYDLSLFNLTDRFWRWIHYNLSKEGNE